MLDIPDLQNRFTHHPPPSKEIVHQYKRIREVGLKMAALVLQFSPEGREQSLAITKIEEAVFWANASIARQK